jgi:uncharacterized protein
MKKIAKANELMWLFGLIFVSLGVAICSKTNLGVSMIAAPTFILQEFVSKFWPSLTVGVTEYLFQGLTLIIMCIAVQRFNWKYLLAFLVAVLYGYMLDLWILIIGSDPFEEIYLRWIMLIVGDVSVAFGVACFFRTYMPLEVPELVVAEVADRYKLNINKTKYFIDGLYLVTSIVLSLVLFLDVDKFDWSTIYKSSFHSLGLGTIVTTIINAPIITLCGKLLDKTFTFEPLIPKLEKVLKRSKNGENEEVAGEENKSV